MKRILVLAAGLCLAATTPLAAFGWGRTVYRAPARPIAVPHYNYARPVPRQIMPRAYAPRAYLRQRVVPQQRFAVPGARVVYGRYGHRMIFGRRGWHETRNWSTYAIVPALVVGGTALSVDTFTDSIDLTAPLESLNPCPGPVCQWGAFSITADGKWAGSWNYPDKASAMSAAMQRCAALGHGECVTTPVIGTAWVVGLTCIAGGSRQSMTSQGNDYGSALTNAYRFAAQNTAYDVLNQCFVVGAIAADGAQLRLAQGSQ